MKKYLVLFIVLGILIFSVPKAQAVTLNDLVNQIKSLNEQITSLKNQLSGLVLNSVAPIKTSIVNLPNITTCNCNLTNKNNVLSKPSTNLIVKTPVTLSPSLTLAVVPNICYADWNKGNDLLNLGTSTSPKKHIQACIDIVSSGQTVIARPGTYLENINFKGKNITVASNFLNTKADADINNTIIDGGQNGSVVTITSGENNGAKLIGFTIQNGKAGTGGGIQVNESSPSLTNLIIKNNVSNGSWPGGGGGININSWVPLKDPTILNNLLVSNNNTAGEGGGIFIHMSSVDLQNTKIINNSSNGNGGGLSAWDPNFVNGINKVYIIGNKSAERGGGAFFSGNISSSDDNINNIRRYVSITNSIIANNSVLDGNCGWAHNGGGISAEYMNTDIINSTIVNNYGGPIGGGIFYSGYFNPDNNKANNINIINTVFYGNKTEWFSPQINLNSNANANISYSDIEGLNSGGISIDSTANIFGLGNIDSDPLFTNPAGNDYSVSNLSPVANSGINSTSINGQILKSPIDDILGSLRPAPTGTMPDMGASEVNSCEKALAIYSSIKYNATCTPLAEKAKYKTYSDLATSKYGVSGATYLDYINAINQISNQTKTDCTNYFKTTLSLPGIPGDVNGAGCIKLDPATASKINQSYIGQVNIPIVLGDINLDCKVNPTDVLLVNKMYTKTIVVTMCNK